MRKEPNPYEKPRTLFERLTFPSLRQAWENGRYMGYYDGKLDGIDESFLKIGTLTRDRNWLMGYIALLDDQEDGNND